MTASPPMEVVRHPAREAAGDRVLLVALPGVGIEPKDFAEHDFVQAVQARRPTVEVVAPAADLARYLDRTVVEDLDRQVILPALAERPARLWFLGISLGGMGALLYAQAHPQKVEGVILLAPFLCTPGMTAEVGRAGGLARWEPGEVAVADTERMLLGWLKDHLPAPQGGPELYLAYGRDDRFAPGHAILGACLPVGRIFLAEGGHDWKTWETLWRQILDADPFAAGVRELGP